MHADAGSSEQDLNELEVRGIQCLEMTAVARLKRRVASRMLSHPFVSLDFNSEKL